MKERNHIRKEKMIQAFARVSTGAYIAALSIANNITSKECSH